MVWHRGRGVMLRAWQMPSRRCGFDSRPLSANDAGRVVYTLSSSSLFSSFLIFNAYCHHTSLCYVLSQVMSPCVLDLLNCCKCVEGEQSYSSFGDVWGPVPRLPWFHREIFGFFAGISATATINMYATESFVKFACVVFEIYDRTNRHTHRQAYRSTLHTYLKRSSYCTVICTEKILNILCNITQRPLG